MVGLTSMDLQAPPESCEFVSINPGRRLDP
jgi:hypothetical protein